MADLQEREQHIGAHAKPDLTLIARARRGGYQLIAEPNQSNRWVLVDIDDGERLFKYPSLAEIDRYHSSEKPRSGRYSTPTGMHADSHSRSCAGSAPRPSPAPANTWCNARHTPPRSVSRCAG